MKARMFTGMKIAIGKLNFDSGYDCLSSLSTKFRKQH